MVEDPGFLINEANCVAAEDDASGAEEEENFRFCILPDATAFMSK